MATNSAPTLAITGTAIDTFAGDAMVLTNLGGIDRSEEHTSELQSQ